MENEKKAKKQYRPWYPAVWEEADVSAMQHLNGGTANAQQQQRALKFIIENICGTYEMPYIPDSSRDSDFAMGKMSVGQQIVKLLKINLSAFLEGNRK